MTQPPPIVVDSAGMVIGDVPCRGCSYNLRGLAAKSRCPECAEAISLSLQGDLLRYSDPGWLDRLGAGTVLILGGLLLLTLIGLRIRVLLFIRPMQLGMGLIANVVIFAGTWLVTMPDPGMREQRAMVLARFIARIGMALAVARGIVLFFTAATLDPMLSALMGLGFLIAAIARTAAEVARLWYMGKIALRIPDEKLASRTTFLSWTYGTSLGASAIINGVISFIMLTLKERPNWFGQVSLLMYWISQLAWMGVIIFSIVYVFMLIRFARAMKLQKTIARVMRLQSSMMPPDHDTSSAVLSPSTRGGGESGN